MHGSNSQDTNKQNLKIGMFFLGGRVIWRSLLVLVTLVVMVSPSRIGSSESPVGRSGKGQAMEPVEAGKEEDEGAEGVEEGDDGVEEVAGQHGGQGEAEERGGQHHVEGRLDEEAGEAGEDAEEGHDAEEGDGGPGGH